MNYNPLRALELLRSGSRVSNAVFRDGQEGAIRHVVEGRGRLLLVQRTGWGKSFVYFIATKLLREQGSGPALLISPLLALMRNQIAAAERMGVRAVTINSDNRKEWREVESQIRGDDVDIVLIAPERLENERFVTEVLSPIAARIGLLVIDEAHCISDWGHDFRPHYRLIERILRSLPQNLRLLATTATANDRVMADLVEILGPELKRVRGELHRPSLRLQTIRLPSQAERLAWLAEHLPGMAGSGIIYTLTKRDATQVADWLCSEGFAVAAYTGDSGERRPDLEQALLDNRLKALVATTALGMGFDKPDLAFVIHYQCPSSVVAYYQQVGRAGRGIDEAYGVLLGGTEDTEITDYFIDSAFPTSEEVRSVLGALETAPDGLSMSELMARGNVPKSRIEKTISLLSLESPPPVVKIGTRWQLTAATLRAEFWERVQRITRLRRDEQRQMQEYLDLNSGHMEYLIRALDGDPTGVTQPDLPSLPQAPSRDLVRRATHCLRRMSVPIEPRRQWPAGGMPRYGLQGKIAAELQASGGRALCYWGDAGWGELVRLGKYRAGRFDDQLVAACRDLVESWRPDPYPAWVACIPSLRHPDLVPDFARRLANALGLPFVAVLTRTEERPEQKQMANSVQQAHNVDGSLGAQQALIRSEPVLLVDDMVDSKWTFTVAAWLLRSCGSGPVWLLALADSAAGS